MSTAVATTPFEDISSLKQRIEKLEKQSENAPDANAISMVVFSGDLDKMGMGRLLMNREMAKKRVPTLAELVQIAEDLEVSIDVCEMSMSLMGIKPEELIDYPNLNYCGVARFLEQSSSSNTTLFI